jgi:hypothetical protein
MKTIFLLGTLLIARAWAVQPLEPRSVGNTPQHTLSVAISTEMTTMLVFPQPISMIVGEGLTDGAAPGLVQYDHQKGAAVVVFRSLQTTKGIYCQIISGETVYFCHMSPEASRPDSVVTVAAPADNESVPAAVPVEEVFAQRLSIPSERMHQLIELARSASILKAKLPEEYVGYDSLLVSMPFAGDGYETRIERISRFSRDDSMVFFGTIKNLKSTPLELAGIEVGVGDSRRMTPNSVTFTKQVLASGQSARFECILVGDGKNERLHLSLKNRFTIQLSQNSNREGD